MSEQQSAPFVFISYAHKDTARVLPILRAMESSGIRFWYDDGIEAGAEWPEYIARKVVDCSKFLLFVSKDYLASQNCTREINFAVSKKKDILSVYLEEVELPLGMEMQLGSYQAMFCNRFENDGAFARSLCSADFFGPCRKNAAYRNPDADTPPQPRTYAPPKQTYTPPTQTYTPPVQTGTPPVQTAAVPTKNKVVAILLALFLGAIGAHKFYLGKPILGILYLVFIWTSIPFFLSIFDAICIAMSTDAALEAKYHCKLK